ncbi:MAG: efflux RND transporter periplasmic adaptor subunit [Phycisphaerales bacterium]
MKTKITVGLAVSALMVGACRKQEGAAAGPAPAAPVSVAVASVEDVPVVLRTIGSVESRARVVVRPQVSGRVLELPAGEGTDVAAGQVLVRIDARPFEVALRSAEAAWTQSGAAAKDAHQYLSRLEGARGTTAVSDRDIEAARAKADGADAEVLAGQAGVDSAKLELEYCTISAPFAGRLGEFQVKVGSVVKENEAGIVELVQFDPIDVACAVPEEQIGAVRAAMEAGAVAVEAEPSGEGGGGVPGTLSFVDSAVDAATGTIRLKATFANQQRRLWPGRFVTVRVLLGHERGSVVVPDAAVQQSQAGAMVYVVKGDKTVEARAVTVGRRVDGRSVVTSGLAGGETVVTEGQLRLAPGASVVVKGGPGAAGGGA